MKLSSKKFNDYFLASDFYKNNDLPLYKPIRYDMYHKITKTTNIDLILPSNKNAQMIMLFMKSDKSKFFLFIFLVNSNAITVRVHQEFILVTIFLSVAQFSIITHKGFHRIRMLPRPLNIFVENFPSIYTGSSRMPPM